MNLIFSIKEIEIWYNQKELLFFVVEQLLSSSLRL